MTANRQKRLLVIGATWEQVPLIRAAKERGCFVMATATTSDAEGLAFADQQAILDPRDLRRVLEIARDFNPDGVTADQCDYSHFASVFVSEKLGLPNAGLRAAQNTTNKFWMRSRCQQAHILQPRFVACCDTDEAQKAVELIGLPVIVKPVDNRGAFGVHVVYSLEELKGAFLDALMNAHSRQVIVEAYIEGTHITVDGCVDQDGQHHNLAIASKQVTGGDKPIITQVNYPADISPEYYEHVASVNSDVIDALGIRGGLTHSEYILDDKGRCFLVETANRGGGVWTSAHIVPTMSGVDTNNLLISNALNEPFPVSVNSFDGFVTLKFFIFKPGKVSHISGLEDARRIDGLEHLRLFIGEGDTLFPPQSGAERHGFVILKSKNKRLADVIYDRVLKTIEVNYVKD